MYRTEKKYYANISESITVKVSIELELLTQ